MRTAFLVALAGTIGFAGQPARPLHAAPIPKHLMATEDPEAARLQGRWRYESIQFGPQNLQPVALEMQVELEIKGNKMIATTSDNTATATIKFDSINGVKRMVMAESRSVDKRGQITRSDDQAFGYLLEGDTLTLATKPGSRKDKSVVDPKKPEADAIVVKLTRFAER